MEPKTETEGSGRARPLLLLVEASPSPAISQLLGAIYEVATASDGEQALAAIRERAPDLVLMDVELPKLDGLATFQKMRAAPTTEQIPVIFLAARSDEAQAARCLDLGAADYLVREVGGRELIARVDRALREARQRRALYALAQTDALTGLANFGALRRRIGDEFKRANRYEYPISAVMIDLDHLKQINDRYGHDVGNRAIVALSTHLRANLRETDFAARFGGDEFVVLLPYQTPTEAAVLMERLRSGFSSVKVSVGPDSLELSLSAGIAGHGTDSPKEGPDHILQAADAALYAAKRAGRDRVVVFEREVGGVDESALDA